MEPVMEALSGLAGILVGAVILVLTFVIRYFYEKRTGKDGTPLQIGILLGIGALILAFVLTFQR